MVDFYTNYYIVGEVEMKKQRTKKYNARLKHLQHVLFALKHKSFAHTSLDSTVTCFHNSRPRAYSLDSNTVRTLALERFKWSTFMAVFFKDANGKINMKSESCFINEPLRQNEVSDYLSDAHATLIKGVNHNFFYGYGWLSCPFEHDWTEEEAFQIFTYTGITNPDQFTKDTFDVTATKGIKKNLA